MFLKESRLKKRGRRTKARWQASKLLDDRLLRKLLDMTIDKTTLERDGMWRWCQLGQRGQGQIHLV
ncbi:hypothetical protein DYQ48_12910 [Xanthomonas hortorum]|nr:hypothetical protein IB62_001670 [Xanthomonas euvesicatoria]QEW15743.1 hypothetical protein DYQ48_12910 [Xanthomonas hortorum]